MKKKAVEKRLCKLHSLEWGTFELEPGGSLRVGRHRDNDIVINEKLVSRFHARFTWDKEMERPAVFDNSSQNGTKVDGELIKTAKLLRDEAKVSIGAYVFRVQLFGCGETPALLKDTDDMVALFTDDGPDLTGKLTEKFQATQLMQRLEGERRTGTLFLDTKDDKQFKVIFCLGRVMSCSIPGYGEGLRALERILRMRSGEFRFSRDLEPQEKSLNLWVSDFIRSRNSRGDPTERFHPTQKIRKQDRPQM